jgi:transmembrane sensor
MENIPDELLIKCLQGKADEKEYESAYLWINSDSANFAYYEDLRNSWISAGIAGNNKSDLNKAWQRVSRRTGVRWFGIYHMVSGWSRFAAVFLLALILGAACYHFIFPRERIFPESEYTVHAPLGAKTSLVLPDSTHVWLNAGSILKYSTHYNFSNRSVYLSGEAYFNVKHSGQLPFIVHTDELVISALGTEFNVKAYPEEKHVETILVSGLIRVERASPADDADKILLKPNQRAYIARGKSTIIVFEVPGDADTDSLAGTREMVDSRPEKIAVERVLNTQVYTSWKDNRMMFDRERMDDLAVKLERVYDVKITFNDEELKDYHISGSLEHETLEQFLYAVRLTIPLDFNIKQNNVVLSLNRQLQERYQKITR